MTVLLGVSGSLLNVVLKQYQISGIARESEVAFQAAHAGIECVLYHDFDNFDAPNPNSDFDVLSGATRARLGTLDCFGSNSADVAGVNPVASGDEQRFEYTWGTPSVCTKMSVYKYYDETAEVPRSILGEVVGDCATAGKCCAQGSECTVIRSRGYNAACTDIGVNSRIVERALIRVY